LSKKNKKSILDSAGISVAGDNNTVNLTDKERIYFLEKEIEGFREREKQYERHIEQVESLNRMLSINLMRVNRELLFQIFEKDK
jgi:hypothetical protein